MAFSIAALGMGFFLASSPPLAGTTPVYALYSIRIFGELKKETNEPSILIYLLHQLIEDLEILDFRVKPLHGFKMTSENAGVNLFHKAYLLA